MSNAQQIIQEALKANPEIRIVLEIAARSLDLENRELPRDFVSATEVAALPVSGQQGIVA